jgi:hypothetical protein
MGIRRTLSSKERALTWATSAKVRPLCLPTLTVFWSLSDSRLRVEEAVLLLLLLAFLALLELEEEGVAPLTRQYDLNSIRGPDKSLCPNTQLT